MPWLSAALVPSAVYAADAAACAKPRFSDVGWTDITATTQVASRILSPPRVQAGQLVVFFG